MEISPADQRQMDAHRRRYEALKAAGTQVAAALSPSRIDEVPVDEARVTLHETVPGGWYTTLILRRGDRLRLVNVDGAGAAALLAWNLHDASERLNHADTLKIQWSAELRRGRVLFSDMGRVVLSIVEDSSGAHDALMGGSDAAGTLAQYGPGPFRNTRDNFILAALKLGLSRRDIAPCVTFFAPVSVAADGRFTWRDDVRRSGDFVELRAEMDLRIALSMAPHPLDPAPSYAPGAVEITRSRGAAAPGGDPCRTASPEAQRGFENTEALLGFGNTEAAVAERSP